MRWVRIMLVDGREGLAEGDIRVAQVLSVPIDINGLPIDFHLI